MKEKTIKGREGKQGKIYLEKGESIQRDWANTAKTNERRENCSKKDGKLDWE